MDEHWKQAKEMVGNEKFTLGSHYSFQALNAPRHLLFVMARYKFAAKMLPPPPGKVLELGCSEGLGTLLLAETGHNVLGVDFDGEAIQHAQKNIKKANCSFRRADFMGANFGSFDAVIALDVIEHIAREKEEFFMQTLAGNLNGSGICVLGTPNATAAPYASPASVAGHVNLYTHARFEALGRKFFKHVFMFGVNDEVVHTGFPAMCHYLILLGCGRRDGK
jgi:2-polyprenyl-3-methyl-5-hydroxy-6-metoxy-1,4-benzoquinol methylase